GAAGPAPASASPTALPPPWLGGAGAGWSAVAPAPGRRDVGRPRKSPAGGGRPAGAGGRSPLFFGDLLEHLLVQGQLGNEALEAGVLGLQLLEPLGLVGLHPPILVAPAVQGRLADTELLADLGEAQALGQIGLGLAQLGDDLFRRMAPHD